MEGAQCLRAAILRCGACRADSQPFFEGAGMWRVISWLLNQQSVLNRNSATWIKIRRRYQALYNLENPWKSTNENLVDHLEDLHLRVMEILHEDHYIYMILQQYVAGSSLQIVPFSEVSLFPTGFGCYGYLAARCLAWHQDVHTVGLGWAERKGESSSKFPQPVWCRHIKSWQYNVLLLYIIILHTLILDAAGLTITQPIQKWQFCRFNTESSVAWWTSVSKSGCSATWLTKVQGVNKAIQDA